MKLIIEIPEKTIAHIRSIYGHGYKGLYDEDRDKLVDAIYHGTLLDSNDSDYAEAQAYFDGEAYGWEQGRKALIDDVKAEINKAYYDITMYSCDEQVSCFASRVSKILNNIGKAESEVQPNE